MEQIAMDRFMDSDFGFCINLVYDMIRRPGLLKTSQCDAKCINHSQWRSEGNWRPGAKLNFSPPPPLKKILKNDIEMSIVFN